MFSEGVLVDLNNFGIAVGLEVPGVHARRVRAEQEGRGGDAPARGQRLCATVASRRVGLDAATVEGNNAGKTHHRSNCVRDCVRVSVTAPVDVPTSISGSL